MERFSIFSPVMGLRKDIPNILLSESFTSDNRNVLFRDSGIENAPDGSEWLTVSDTEQSLPGSRYAMLIHYHEGNVEDGTGFMTAFTADKVYVWTATGWSEVYTASKTITHWSAVSYGKYVVFTNGVDPVQKFDGSAVTTVGQMTSGYIKVGEDADGNELYIETARYVIDFENHLLLGYVTSNGRTEGSDLFWNVWGDIEDWESTGSGGTTIPNKGNITGFGRYGNFLIIFKQESIHRMWLTDDEIIFNRAVMSEQVGTESPLSIRNGAGGELYFMDTSRKIRTVNGIMNAAPWLSEPIDSILRDIPGSLIPYVCTHYCRDYDCMLWAIPSASDSTENDLLVSQRGQSFTLTDQAIAAMSTGKREVGRTIDQLTGTIDDLPTTYENADLTIDQLGGPLSIGYPPDIYGDYDGTVRLIFGGDSTTVSSYFVLATDVSEAIDLIRYKRFLQIELFYEGKTEGDFTIYVKRDNEASWQTAGTVSMISTAAIASAKLPINYRAKSLQVKVSSSDPYKVYGLIIGYVMGGER